MARRSRPLTDAAANPGGVYFGQLRQDHARLSRVLREVEAQRARLQSHADEALPVLAEAVKYLLDYQHSFHHPREDRLFQELAAARPRLHSELRALGREHRIGLASARALGIALARARATRLRGRRATLLARRVQQYVDTTREHMRHEERAIFYARLERALRPTRWHALAADDPDATDPMGNPVLLARLYPHLSAQLGETIRELSSGTRIGDTGGGWALAFVDACGELLHDGLDVARSNGAAILAAESPLAAVRALPGIGRRTLEYAMSVAGFPARLALGCGAKALHSLAPARAVSRAGSG